MPIYIALLRAVNVGGTGKLPMSELRTMCLDAGFTDVTTYIASGNVVLRTETDAANVKHQMELRLKQHAAKPVSVIVRTFDELVAVLEANPFKETPPNQSVTIFLDEPPPKDLIDRVTGQKGEELQLGRREIYVHYINGIANSTLKIPIANNGTGRNINTLTKLKEIALKLQ